VVAAFPALSCSDPDYLRVVPLFYILVFLLLVVAPACLAIGLRHIVVTTKRIHDPVTTTRYGLLYCSYLPQFYYWEILILLRRAVLVAIMFNVLEPGRRASLLSLINFAFFLAHIAARPYVSANGNRIESVSLCILSMMTMALAGMDSPPSKWQEGLLGVIVIVPTLVFAVIIAIDKLPLCITSRVSCLARLQQIRSRATTTAPGGDSPSGGGDALASPKGSTAQLLVGTGTTEEVGMTAITPRP